MQGLEEVEHEGTTWRGREGREDYPDRLLDLSPEQVTDLITELSIERGRARSNERDYCLTVRNHFLAHDKVEEATDVLYDFVDEGMDLHPNVYARVQRKRREFERCHLRTSPPDGNAFPAAPRRAGNQWPPFPSA